MVMDADMVVATDTGATVTGRAGVGKNVGMAALLASVQPVAGGAACVIPLLTILLSATAL